MNRVSIISPLEHKGWDEFVEERPHGLISHLSDSARILSESFRHIQPFYVILRGFGSRVIQAALPLCLVKSRLTGNRLVSLPFATLCDPLALSSTEFRILFEEAIGLMRRLKASFIELKMLNFDKGLESFQGRVEQFYRHHYLSLDQEPRVLKKCFHRTCIRQRIQRAQKRGVKKRIGTSERDLREFYSLHVLARKRLGLPPQPYRFIRKIWEVFRPSGRISLLLADWERQNIGAIVTLQHKNRVSAEYAASDDRFSQLSPNHLLFWEAIKSAYENGFEIFDFGRTSPQNIGLMDFKRRWGTQVVDLPQFYYPGGEDRTDLKDSHFLKYFGRICDHMPNFALQLIGNSVYKHLA